MTDQHTEELVADASFATQTPGAPGLDAPPLPMAPAVPAEAVFDVPVRVQAVLARRHVTVAELLALGPGGVLALDKRLGEPVEIMINDRLIGRGELVRVDDGIGITMTEIVKQDR